MSFMKLKFVAKKPLLWIYIKVQTNGPGHVRHYTFTCNCIKNVYKIPAMIRDKILTVKCIIRVVTTVHSYNNCSFWVSHVFCSVSATKLNVRCIQNRLVGVSVTEWNFPEEYRECVRSADYGNEFGSHSFSVEQRVERARYRYEWAKCCGFDSRDQVMPH